MEELAAPAGHSDLLEMILETAAGVISARAGALFLVDEAAGDLVCEAAIGGSAEKVKAIRVPLGHGIAGGVALSGLPLAVDAREQRPALGEGHRRARRLRARQHRVRAAVLRGQRDRLARAARQGRRSSFSPADLHALSLFAHQAAVTIEQSRTRLNAGALLASALGEQGVEGAVAQQLRGFGTLIDRDPSFRASLELARLVREVVQAGDRERQACSEILRELHRVRPGPAELTLTAGLVCGLRGRRARDPRADRAARADHPRVGVGRHTGKGVNVAVIDSGVDADHPAVGGRIEYAAMVEDGDEITVDTEPHKDDFGHGTACAGIIRSLAPDCSINSVKVLGAGLKGRGNVFAAGLRWAIENGMNVCNMSLGTTKRDFYSLLHELVDEAYFNNVMLVTAANNMPQASFPSRTPR